VTRSPKIALTCFRILPFARPAPKTSDHRNINEKGVCMLVPDIDRLIAALEDRFELSTDATRHLLHRELHEMIALHAKAGRDVPARLLALDHRMAEAEIDDSFDNMPV
jgi:hypothetical protein